MTTRHAYAIANAFPSATKGDDSGNPAAVACFCRTMDRGPPDAVMQAAASELGLSETAFAKRADVEVVGAMAHRMYDIRWFTPKCEINLCGHASMATAHEIFRAPGNEHVTKIAIFIRQAA